MQILPEGSLHYIPISRDRRSRIFTFLRGHVKSVPARNETLEGLNARLVAHVDCLLMLDKRVSYT